MCQYLSAMSLSESCIDLTHTSFTLKLCSLKHTFAECFFGSTCWSRRWGSSSFLPFSCLHGHTPHEGVVYTHQDVLWFDVCVDDFTFRVEVIQTLQDLQAQSDQQTHVLLLKNHAKKIQFSSPSISPPFAPSLFLRAKLTVPLMLVILWARQGEAVSFVSVQGLWDRSWQRGWQRLKWLNNFTCSSGGWGENACVFVWSVNCTIVCTVVVGLKYWVLFWVLSVSCFFVNCFLMFNLFFLYSAKKNHITYNT